MLRRARESPTRVVAGTLDVSIAAEPQMWFVDGPRRETKATSAFPHDHNEWKGADPDENTMR